ncbi:hypothetical protein JRQ81_012551 [Phrynocephalus forsythii]|uniref:Retrotransposon gag domain-containing protein n=1 Tax=Phrynocephalus forsythii TaxID=171643 RepID=A0A9Q1B525_9SAUR|nr:hypothetical protein JRQ81_012551 [Phrynocephalus forsythii]
MPILQSKVVLVVSFLSDPALAWVSPLLESDHASLSNLTIFLQDLEQMFGDANQEQSAELVPQSIRQGCRSVADYAAEFCCLAANTS